MNQKNLAATYRFLRRLRIARITPKELMDKLAAKENISIVDRASP